MSAGTYGSHPTESVRVNGCVGTFPRSALTWDLIASCMASVHAPASGSASESESESELGGPSERGSEKCVVCSARAVPFMRLANLI
jgi:hypothetical protein